jgi:LPXTG-site transpeptidase (sortase) family protein
MGIELTKRYSKPEPVSAQPIVVGNVKQKVIPVSLKIQSAGIEVPILSSHKIWEERAKSAVYFSKTPLPGKQGNSVIYGHNWPNLLGNLNKAKKGDLVEVYFNDGSTEKFKIIQKVNVSADQTHILNQTKDSRITIYTCSGILDTKRLVVVAVKV